MMNCPFKRVVTNGSFKICYTDLNGQPQTYPVITNGQCSVFVVPQSEHCPMLTLGDMVPQPPQQMMGNLFGQNPGNALMMAAAGNNMFNLLENQQENMEKKAPAVIFNETANHQLGNTTRESTSQQQPYEYHQQPEQQIYQIVQQFADDDGIAGQNDDKFAALNAIRCNDLEGLEKILAYKKIDITVTDQEGNNVFHLICMNKNEDEAMQILGIVYKYQSFYGSHFLKLLNTPNVSGHWPIHEAANVGQGNLIEELYSKGALLNVQTTRTEDTCMTIASNDRKNELVIKLIDLGACVNLINISKMAAIHPAIQDGNEEMMEYIFKNNVDVYDVKKYTKDEKIISRCQSHMRERKKRKKKEKHPEYPIDSKRRRRCKCGSQANIEIPHSPQELNFKQTLTNHS